MALINAVRRFTGGIPTGTIKLPLKDTKQVYTFKVPNGITVIEAKLYLNKVGDRIYIINKDNGIAWNDTTTAKPWSTYTKYVGVTPGKPYSLLYKMSPWQTPNVARLSWGPNINEHRVDVEDY